MRTFNILEKLIVNPEADIIVPKSWIGCWMRRELFVVERGGGWKIRPCLMNASFYGPQGGIQDFELLTSTSKLLTSCWSCALMHGFITPSHGPERRTRKQRCRIEFLWGSDHSEQALGGWGVMYVASNILVRPLLKSNSVIEMSYTIRLKFNLIV